MLAEKKLSGQDLVDSDFRKLSLRGDLDNLYYYINHGNVRPYVADVNSKDPDTGMTALHNAALKGHEKVVEVLLDNGAAIDPEDFFGNTPLGHAVKKNMEHVVRLLIQRGADAFKAFDDPLKIIEFFKGDIDWMPEGLKTKLMRAKRSRQAFGM